MCFKTKNQWATYRSAFNLLAAAFKGNLPLTSDMFSSRALNSICRNFQTRQRQEQQYSEL